MILPKMAPGLTRGATTGDRTMRVNMYNDELNLFDDPEPFKEASAALNAKMPD